MNDEAHGMNNALSRYYPGVATAVRELGTSGLVGEASWFQPGWDLPPSSPLLDRFFSAATMTGGRLDDYRGRPMWFLDLTGNPRVRTTKTFGSMIIVARALAHTAATGEPVMLLTASAANKAVALRDTVLRAYESGLATPETLRVAVVVPVSSLPKLWDSKLAHERELAATNPVAVYGGAEREDVKRLATGAVSQVTDEIAKSTGFRLWYTLDPHNYMAADVVRAFYEHDNLEPGERYRWHSHAVSSCYGFLGVDFGKRILSKDGRDGQRRDRYLLVQHLETPDLVTGLRFAGRQCYELPEYQLDRATGLLRQAGEPDAHFPEACYSIDERLERTFYTRRPPTTARVQDLIDRQGGDGIVVSLHECLLRYQEVRQLLRRAGMERLPEDPRKLREWAMVMATVAALTAIDRGLIPEGDEILIHGSGAYSEGEYESAERSLLRPVETADDVAALLRETAKA